MVGEAGKILHRFGRGAGNAGGEPGLWSDGDFGAAGGYCVVDLVGGVAD